MEKVWRRWKSPYFVLLPPVFKNALVPNGALRHKDPLCVSECPDDCRGRDDTGALCHGGCRPVGGALPGVPSLSSVLRASTVQSFRTGRNKGRVKPPVAAKPVFEPWMPRAQLSSVAMELLSAAPKSQFVLPRGLTWDGWAPQLPSEGLWLKLRLPILLMHPPKKARVQC